LQTYIARKLLVGGWNAADLTTYWQVVKVAQK